MEWPQGFKRFSIIGGAKKLTEVLPCQGNNVLYTEADRWLIWPVNLFLFDAIAVCEAVTVMVLTEGPTFSSAFIILRLTNTTEICSKSEWAVTWVVSAFMWPSDNDIVNLFQIKYGKWIAKYQCLPYQLVRAFRSPLQRSPDNYVNRQAKDRSFLNLFTGDSTYFERD